MPNLSNIIPPNFTLGIVILLVSLLAFYRGRKVLYSLLLTFFPAVLVYKAFLAWQTVRDMLPAGFLGEEYVNRLIFFAVIYFFIFYIVQKIIGFEIYRHGIYKVIDSVFLAVGLVSQSCILIFQTLAPLPDFYHLGARAELFLAGAAGNVILLVIAISALLYSSRA